MSFKEQYEPPRDSYWDEQMARDLKRLSEGAATSDVVVPAALALVGVGLGLLVAYLAGVLPTGSGVFSQTATIGVMIASGVLAGAAIFAAFTASRRYAEAEALRLELMLTEARLDRMHGLAEERLSGSGTPSRLL